MAKEIYTRQDYSIAKIAYLAGIIDGEGSIYIGNFSSNPKTGDKYYQTNIEVTNSSWELIEFLEKNFGGRVYAYKASQTPKNSRKPYWRWIACGDRVTHLCELIYPYLTAKLRQCEIMISMRKTYTANGKGLSKKGKQGVQRNSKELLGLRQSLFEEMQSLHCRNYSN